METPEKMSGPNLLNLFSELKVRCVEFSDI